MLKLHTSNTARLSVVERELRQDLRPNGIWYSDFDNEFLTQWRAFCYHNEFTEYQYLYSIELKPSARVFKIDSEEDWLEFQQEYTAVSYQNTILYYDWPSFKKDFDVFEVSYHKMILTCQDLKSPALIYSLDCDSGCIVNPDAIENIILLQELNVPLSV